MKGKAIFMAIIMVAATVGAQERNGQVDRESRRAEMTEKAAERFVKEFGLGGDAKKTFTDMYVQYQTEMRGNNKTVRPKAEERSKEGKKKTEMTETEATEKLNELFSNQEKLIETMQARLAVQKKYSSEFAKVLTPQQVLKVLESQRNAQWQRNGRPQGSGMNRGVGRGGFGERGFGGGDGFGDAPF